MEERRLLCVRLKYSDCTWIERLGAEGWNVQTVNDLTNAHRQLQEHPYLVGLLVPGPLEHEGWIELDGFLRAHGGLEWVGAFEPAVVQLPVCRDVIVDHLFDHHTTPINPVKLASTLGHASGHATLRRASRDAQALLPPSDSTIVGHSPARASCCARSCGSPRSTRRCW